MNNTLRFLESILPVSNDLWSELKCRLKERKIGKNQFLLMPGEVSNNIYFVSHGVLMKWNKSGADTLTTSFSMECEICVSCSSFFEQIEAVEFIQALENTVVYCLSYGNYLDLIESYREFNHLCRKLFVKAVKEKEEFSNKMIRKRLMDRYLWIRHRYPRLEQRVPGRYIAQLLGMSDVTYCQTRSKANKLSEHMIREILLLE